MAEYFLICHETCSECLCGHVNLTPEMERAILAGESMIPIPAELREKPMIDFICPHCKGAGYRETQVNLLDVLKKLEWSTPVFGYEDVYHVHKFEDLRIEDEPS